MLLPGGLVGCDFSVLDAENRKLTYHAAEMISSPHADTGHAVFVRATYLVCHRLISSWKSDLNTSLAALELLGGLARIKSHDQGETS